MTGPSYIRRSIVDWAYTDIGIRLSSLRDEKRNVEVSGTVEEAADRRLYWAVRNQVGLDRVLEDFGRKFDVRETL